MHHLGNGGCESESESDEHLLGNDLRTREMTAPEGVSGRCELSGVSESILDVDELSDAFPTHVGNGRKCPWKWCA